MALVYATRADLVGYAPAGTVLPDEPEATRLLTSASKEILRATKTAIYDADGDGYPTDADIRQAFRDATCAQALWWLTGGADEQGASGQYQNVAIGSVTLGRGSRDSGAAATDDRLAPQAAVELDNAGITPGVIVTWP